MHTRSYRFRSSPKLQSIRFACEPYVRPSNDCYIYIQLRDWSEHSADLDEIIQLLSDKGFFVLNNSLPVFHPVYYNNIAINANNCREVIDCLCQERWISEEDKARLGNNVAEVERCLSIHAKLTSHLSTTQIKKIQAFSMPHIQSILNATSRIELMLTCLHCIANDNVLTPDNRKWFRIMLKNVVFRSRLKKPKKSDKEALFQAVVGIAKIYHGQARIESYLSEGELGIPRLTLQREALLYYAKEKLCSRFSDFSNEGKFFIMLGMNMLALGYQMGRGDFVEPEDLIRIIRYYLDYSMMPDHVFVALVAGTLKEAGLAIDDFNKTDVAVLYKASWHRLKTKRVDLARELKEAQVDIQQSNYFGENGFLARKRLQDKAVKREASEVARKNSHFRL